MRYLILALLCASCTLSPYKPSEEPEVVETEAEVEVKVEGDSMDQLIIKAIHVWLDNKMDDDIYEMLSSDKARWRNAGRVSSVVSWFDSISIITENVAWTNFYYLVEELRWHSSFDLSEKEYLTVIKRALASYSWQQEDEF